MPTILITGVSRGLGFGFLKTLSSNPANLIVGLVRNKAATEKKIAEELGDRSNIHIVEADLTDHIAVKRSVDEVSDITGGSLDYLIANAGLVPRWSAHLPMGLLGRTPVELEREIMESYRVNVVGNIHLFNFYLPLVFKGIAKKVIAISSGLADFDLVPRMKLDITGPYTMSKVAMNMAVAKYQVEYADRGVLFMSISPGLVEAGHQDNLTAEEEPYLQKLIGGFLEYAPNMQKSTPEEAATDVWSVVEKASLEKGDGGSFVSHKGNQQWLWTQR